MTSRDVLNPTLDVLIVPWLLLARFEPNRLLLPRWLLLHVPPSLRAPLKDVRLPQMLFLRRALQQLPQRQRPSRALPTQVTLPRSAASAVRAILLLRRVLDLPTDSRLPHPTLLLASAALLLKLLPPPYRASLF